MSSWEDELQEYFPGYLLPAAARTALTREAASRFLVGLGGAPDALTTLLAASALSPVTGAVHDFSNELPAVARVLPSRTRVERAESEGHVRGRLDVAATLQRKASGRSGSVVTRVRERHFDLPENVLLATTADRLVGLLARLDGAGAIEPTKTGWAAGFRACAERMRHALESTVLRQVPRAKIDSSHTLAARAARHPAYALALTLHEAMKDIDSTDPARIARLVAEGALAPHERATRFEIAILIRLGRTLEETLVGRGFAMARALIDDGRDHVFEFTRDDRCLRIHYDQVKCLPQPGPRDLAMRHYFDSDGRFRPDLTLEFRVGDRRTRLVIVEVKHSENPVYLKSGFHEALLYRAEYGDIMTGWPKAILVVSSEGAIRGAPRREDEVIAVPWNQWVPEAVMHGLLETLDPDASAAEDGPPVPE